MPARALVAFSGVQSATGHRSDIAAISSVARRGGGDRLRGRLSDGGRGRRWPRTPARGRAGDGGPQVPAQRRPGDGLLLPVQGRAGAVHPDQRRLARGRRPVRQLLRPDHGAVADGIAVRQLHQLAGGLRQQDVARRLRPVRPRRHLQPEPRPRGAAAGRPDRCGLGAGCPARGEPEHHPQGSARRPRTGPGRPCPVRAARHRLGARRRPALLGPPLQPRGRHRPARRGPRVAGAATRAARFGTDVGDRPTTYDGRPRTELAGAGLTGAR